LSVACVTPLLNSIQIRNGTRRLPQEELSGAGLQHAPEYWVDSARRLKTLTSLSDLACLLTSLSDLACLLTSLSDLPCLRVRPMMVADTVHKQCLQRITQILTLWSIRQRSKSSTGPGQSPSWIYENRNLGFPASVSCGLDAPLQV